MSTPYDVIIIGSGAGGGTLAHRLAPSGKRILVIERGGWLPREQENWDADAVFVKNRYQPSETWYDKGGAIVAGGKGVINGLLQPGEIQTIVIETPYNPKMSSNAWNFSHANGTVKTSKVKGFLLARWPSGDRGSTASGCSCRIRSHSASRACSVGGTLSPRSRSSSSGCASGIRW